MKTLRLGTRGSRLALVQARHVQQILQKSIPDLHIEEVIIRTLGDNVTGVPLFQVGGQGLFIREIERALQSQDIDLAVHSLKDMPHALGEGLTLAAVTTRADARDVLISRAGESLAQLASGARIGTSSLRRQAQLLSLRPDLSFVALRGNLDTRLKKLEAGEADAIVLAAAGLERLGLSAHCTQFFSFDELTPAAGQGALGLECRSADLELLTPILAPLIDVSSQTAAQAERAFLAAVEGGCQVPLGVHATLDNSTLFIRACIGDPRGCRIVRKTISGPATQAAELGRTIAAHLLDQGGREILGTLRRPPDDR
ncbi:MAG TPA: hydroxymethylbilane synthase [Candidatus Ozemobacteraceae bacterium]|nr:hydroxymethylbilane synthase [Candidatus Ozemobacteraceae bacterium]